MGWDEEEEDKTQLSDAQTIRKLGVLQTNIKTCLTVIAGPGVGKMLDLEGECTVGRSNKADITIPDGEISRKHVRISMDEKGVFVEDLGSTNGTLVNGEKMDKQYLEDGDKIQVGTVTILKFSYQDELDERFQQHMYESASRDGLTGAYNKTHFLERLASEVAFSSRHGTGLGLLMFDIDHFKKINDNHGHLAGDHVLHHLAELIHPKIRAEDLFARYGGEEFAVVLRGADRDSAMRSAERLRGLIEDAVFDHDGTGMTVTISIGGAVLPEDEADDAKALIALADKRLYEAKRAGRNRVVL